jgi:hypothetical protein
MSNIVTDPQNSYRSAAGKRVGNEILDMFDGPVGMLALFLLSQATEKTSMTSTASNRKISSNNVVGSQRFGFCVLNFLSILSDFLSREKLTQK